MCCQNKTPLSVENWLFNTNKVYLSVFPFISISTARNKKLSFLKPAFWTRYFRKQTDVIIMDFAKVFDKVPHNRLIQKLNRYGISGPLKIWIQNFLSGRTQRVVCDGEKSSWAPVTSGVQSSWAPVTSGVPQGSVMGPILFLVYINDLPKGLESQTRLFADDTIVYRAISDPSDGMTLQSDLDKLAEWEDRWQMTFHPQKCIVLRITWSRKPIIFKYTLHGHILETHDSAKYLGMQIHQTLSWNEHINNTCKKPNSSIGFLGRNLQIFQQHIKKYISDSPPS